MSEAEQMQGKYQWAGVAPMMFRLIGSGRYVQGFYNLASGACWAIPDVIRRNELTHSEAELELTRAGLLSGYATAADIDTKFWYGRQKILRDIDGTAIDTTQD